MKSSKGALFRGGAFLGVCSLFFYLGIGIAGAQMSTNPRLCGGYQRESRGYIDFKFDENTAPPGTAMRNKICMWTISPSVPSEFIKYNMTIRNANLDCKPDGVSGGDSIAINYFDVAANRSNMGESHPGKNPVCLQSNEVWQRTNVEGTVMVVILYVEEVVYGKGFYLEWEEGYEARFPGYNYTVRNTYYSYGRPSVAPNPYFAAGFRQNEIATFGFVKANFTTGYTMEMNFWKIQHCEGQDDWQTCGDNYLTLYSIENNGMLKLEKQWFQSAEDTEFIYSPNGFFVIVKIENKFMAGGRFTMFFDTIRA